MKTGFRIVGSIALVAIVVAVGCALGLAKYWQIQRAMKMPPPPEAPVAVIVKPVSALKYRQQTTVIGTILAPKSIMLSNEVAGTVSSLNFEPGNEVAAGQVLVELDTSVEKAELDSARARVKLAKSVLGRMRQAATSDAVTAAEVDEAQAQSEQATAATSQLEAVIARKTLRAPFHAKIGLSNTHVGQFLPSGFQIASLQSIEDYVHVDFMIPQSAADSVTIGDQVTLVDNAGNFKAKIIAMDARSDRLSRNLMTRAILQPVPPQLVPGDSTRVILEYGQELESTAVPVEAVRRAPMNTFVYVVEEDKENAKRAHARTVIIGNTFGDRVSVLQGLMPGEQVVADGSFKLHENALIVPVATQAGAPGTEASGTAESDAVPASAQTAAASNTTAL